MNDPKARSGKPPPQSLWSRVSEIGTLAASIGIDVATTRLGGILDTQLGREARALQGWSRSAIKMTTTLGNLKGAAMKVGQMLSLYESFLPAEITSVLAELQNQAPAVPFQNLESVIKNDVPHYKKLIAQIEDQAIASASVGQVHRATMHDGRKIVLKIQYPGIDRAIASDMKSLRIFLSLLAASLPFKADTRAMLDEIHTMLLSELDYKQEANQQSEFRAFFRSDSQIIIPEILPELCGPRVLTSIYEPGMSLDQIAQLRPAARNTYGQLMFQFTLDQLFRFGKLHSDPNAANFAFRENNQLILYDFGSVKQVPTHLILGYRQLLEAILMDRDPALIPPILKTMGIHKFDGSLIPTAVIEDGFNVYEPVFLQDYCFGGSDTQELIRHIRELGQQHFLEGLELVFPADIIFIDRTIGGLFANLSKLGACAHWGQMIQERLALTKPTI